MSIDSIIHLLDAHGYLGALALAFFAWAFVVWHLGMRVLRRLDALGKDLIAVRYILANRITKIEAHLEGHEAHKFEPYRNGS